MFKDLIEGKFDGSVVDELNFEQYKIFFKSIQNDVEGAVTRNDLTYTFMDLIQGDKLNTLTSIHDAL